MFSSKEEKEPKPSSLKFAISSESENILPKLLKGLRHDLFPKTTSITDQVKKLGTVILSMLGDCVN